MIGERENFNSQTQYGSLVMREYNIDGNEISGFYDSSDNLVFVLDNTVNSAKPNVLLVINPDADKKWDEILSGDYGVDLEMIRPKQDNKYQKFDIEYSGLGIYDSLIKAYEAGDSLEESLNQLMILRDSAARHSAMTRLNMANEIITKTNATIVKTKESVVRLQARLKTLRAKLAEAKKSIGREPTKQSAAKILKLESQIEATNEKLKRANERLKSAQRRLETATVDAELASELLNQPSGEIKQVAKKRSSEVVPVKKTLPVQIKKAEPEYDEYEESEEFKEEFLDNDKEEEYTDEETETEETKQIEEETTEEETEKVEPLFNEDPQILNNDIAFKPISFEPPAVPEITKSDNAPVASQDTIATEETTETTTQEETEDNKTDYETKEDSQSVLESMKPIPFDENLTPVPVVESSEPEEIVKEEIIEEKPEVKTEETDKEESLDLEFVKEDVRQYEPEVVEKTTDTEEEKTYNEYAVVPPVVPVQSVMPQSSANISVVDDVEPRRSKFFYYLLLILLIVLAVFTLWLYQYRIKPTAPVLAASVEKTELPKEQNTVFKKTGNSSKTSKNIKAPVVKEVKRNVDDDAVFLDEEPVVEPVQEQVIEETPVVKESVEVIEPVDVAPEIIDDVPARVTTSGQPQEDEKTALSEEDILASKPEYQPGSKYDEMFVADEGGEIISPTDVEYVEDDIIYMPQEQDMPEYVEENTLVQDPYFDEEEAAYQAEQAELYYEE